MNNDYKKKNIDLGISDYATLIAVGPDFGKEEDAKFVREIHFGGDGDYSAHVITMQDQVPEHYQLVGDYSWLKIYDDFGLKVDCNCRCKVYRAGEFGVLLQVQDIDQLQAFKLGWRE